MREWIPPSRGVLAGWPEVAWLGYRVWRGIAGLGHAVSTRIPGMRFVVAGAAWAGRLVPWAVAAAVVLGCWWVGFRFGLSQIFALHDALAPHAPPSGSDWWSGAWLVIGGVAVAVAGLRLRLRWWVRPAAAVWCGVAWTSLVAAVVWAAAWASLDVRWDDPALAVAVAAHWRAGYAIAWAAPGIVAFGALLHLGGLWLLWVRSKVFLSVLTFGLGRILVLVWRLMPFVLCTGLAMWVWEIGLDRVVREIERLYALSVVWSRAHVSAWTGFAPERMPWWGWAIVGALVMWIVSETIALVARGLAAYVDRLSVQVALLRRGGVVETVGDDGVPGRRTVLGIAQRMDAWRARLELAHERSLREIEERRAFHQREIAAIERQRVRLARELGDDAELEEDSAGPAPLELHPARAGDGVDPRRSPDGAPPDEARRLPPQAPGADLASGPAAASDADDEGSFAPISADRGAPSDAPVDVHPPVVPDPVEAPVRVSSPRRPQAAVAGARTGGPQAAESREDQIARLLDAFRAADQAEADAEIELRVEEGTYIGREGPELTPAQREARDAELAAQEAADVAYFAEEAAEFEAGSEAAYSPPMSEPEWPDELQGDVTDDPHADSLLKVTLNADGMPLDDAWGDPLGERLAALKRDLAGDVEEGDEPAAAPATVAETSAGDAAPELRSDPQPHAPRAGVAPVVVTDGPLADEPTDAEVARVDPPTLPAAGEMARRRDDPSVGQAALSQPGPTPPAAEPLRLPLPDWTLRTNPDGAHSLLAWEYQAGDYLFIRAVPGNIRSAATVIERLADGASRYDLSTVRSLDRDAAEPFPSLARMAGLGLLEPGGYDEVMARLERDLAERRQGYLNGLSATTQALSTIDNRSAQRVAAIAQGLLDAARHRPAPDA